MNRYSRNQSMISSDEQILLNKSKVCVIGCGGLGGYNIEMLARLGIGTITIIDGDVFDESNLNRQLYSTSETMGYKKADIAKDRLGLVNPEVTVISINKFLTKENGFDLLKDSDIIVDALDSMDVRKEVVHLCESLQVPFVYGAIAGWYGQVATILPGDQTLEQLNKSSKNKGEEVQLGNPSFTPALVASIQVSEVLKLITGKGDILRHSFLHINMLNHEYEVYDL